VRKNGHIHNGKQNYYCNSCKRQFVENGQEWFVDSKERAQIERLLLERISLRGICRVMQVSLSWLLGYLKEVHNALPDDLNVIEVLPDEAGYLDDRFEEEIFRLLKKKDPSRCGPIPN
jgi:transposase-like protein